jgi:predicted methyltransferase
VRIASRRKLYWAAAALLAAASAAAADDMQVAKLRAALAAPGRAEADRARDTGRKPAEVVAFLGIEEGMTVVDLIAAGGYYTEVLSAAVGSGGRVYAQNGEYVLKMRDGANDKAMTARLAGGRLANVRRLDREIAELGLEPGSVDAAVTALNFHDIYNGRGPEAAQAFLTAVRSILKPGRRRIKLRTPLVRFFTLPHLTQSRKVYSAKPFPSNETNLDQPCRPFSYRAPEKWAVCS